MGNNGVSDGAGNQDNQHVTIKDVEDSDNSVTIVVDLATVHTVLANILAYLFSPLSP